MKRFLIFIFVIFLVSAKAQVNAPSFRCISCNAAGDLKLTWVIPPDPSTQFLRYDIYRSSTLMGTYTYTGSVATRTITTFTDPSTGIGNAAPYYYYIRTISTVGSGTVASAPSDTLRSLFVNVTGIGTGIASMSYNNLHNPSLSTSTASFSIYREHPIAAWTNIGNTAATNYSETISICTANYNYQIQLADNSGCVSSSNIKGGVFFDQTAPTKPVFDSVSIDAGGQSHLGWDPSPSGDCIGYIIYQQNAGGAWINIDTVYGINNTAYTNTNVVGANGSVNYCIAPFDSCQKLGLQTSDQNTIFLSAKYDICGRSAKLHWKTYKNLIGGFLKYNVYCSINSAAYTLIGTTADTNFVQQNLSPGKNYCYFVRVFNTNQTITSSSNVRCFVASAPPASSFAYVQSVSIDFAQHANITIYADTSKSCKGFNIYKSEDGMNYSNVAFMAYTAGTPYYYYVDPLISAKQKSYYYKATVLDSCGNERYTSNVGKSILLKVKNDNESIFYNNLSWTDYGTWLGGVIGYNIYRVVNEVPQTTPIGFVPFGRTTFTDNVEDITNESGKVGYYVQAAENFGNPYGISAVASSNIADAYVEVNIFVPNAFTPEGENRVWLPQAQFVDKTEYRVSVFDRWGIKVFETTDDDKGWNGDGREQGTYVYLIQYKNARGEYVEIKGPVTMIR